MNQREADIKSIAHALALWQVKLSSLAVLNFFDAHIVSEHTVCSVLNKAFGFKLTSANKQVRNHPGVDLIDDGKKLAVQVSATPKASKVQRTLKLFHSHQLGKRCDRLVILIIGKKQRTYRTLTAHAPLNFIPARDIWDVSDLLRHFNTLSDHVLSELAQILARATEPPKSEVKRMSGEALVKKSLVWRSRLTKQLLRRIDRQYWEQVHYEPWHRFKYSRMQIRSAAARPFTFIEDEPGAKISTEFIIEPWDFYDNGLEFVVGGGDAIFDRNGHWDILDLQDERENRKEYRVVRTHTFVRIPFEFMAALDMEPDSRTGWPTLYVHYAKDGMPYEEVRYGTIGVFHTKQLRRDFDSSMRRELS